MPIECLSCSTNFRRNPLTDGFLLIDKPVGVTSHDVVAAVRRQLGVRRVGHGGTLDPFATGLLLVLVNRATRLMRHLSALKKEYVGVIKLGVRTSTDDLTGESIATSDAWKELRSGDIARSMGEFLGHQVQRPPLYSAKKIGGQPAHRRVRRGEQVKLDEQPVSIDRFELTRFDGSDVGFVAEVSTGTYIRSLARDLGEALGCGAHLASLRRTRIGPFNVDSATASDQVTWDSMTPPANLVDHLPRIVIGEEDRAAVFHGKRIRCDDDSLAQTTAVFSEDGLVAIAEARGDGYLYPRVVLN